ncbi:LuxR C-terminal-related transcriptional regulator [Novosphingobium guangzhouense]|uniref:Helix-turn-helix transcriptional regulator n=1 Tax=Novosphingobium guangzhouense TaxID=1850347 RepID=A0A2K2G161_9SPHN|nr:response regulator transcription factor [Novosphingobium guangzhouense]PNU04781.1 helix-turn-helix transcriptional regulator [Novosphingobium guangzhouense]
MAISVSIINPSTIGREGLRRIVSDGGIAVMATAASAAELTELPMRDDHLVLIDMPRIEDQLDALHQLADRDFHQALVLADKFDLGVMLTCFEHGARGYTVKDMPCDTLIALLRLAALGHRIMPPDVADMLRRENLGAIAHERVDGPPAQGTNLSQRENDVLSCLMAGYSNKHIARKLRVTEATVKVHVKAILRKLNVANRTQAAMWATARARTGAQHCSDLG